MFAVGRIVSSVAIRSIGAISTLFAVSVIFFVLVDWLPGDFATATASRDTLLETIVNTQYELGLFKGAAERYWDWLSGVLRGDFGVSWYTRIDIATLIANRFWHSLWLAAWASLIAVPLGIVLGIISAARQGSRFDRVVNVGALTAISVPDFVVAYGLMALLGVHFKIFPVFVAYEPSLSLGERLAGTGLPVLSLAIVTTTPILRLTRASIIHILSSPYIEMAELKGMGNWRVVLKHALPNAIGPIANAVVLVVGNLMVGLVIIETVFTYPGLGELLITAVTTRDVPLVQVCGLLCAAIYLILNLCADVIATISNPRLLYAPPKRVPFSLAVVKRRAFALGRFARGPVGLAGGAAALLALAWVYWPDHSQGYAYELTVPPAKPGERAELTFAQMQSGEMVGLVHYDYFGPKGVSAKAHTSFEGKMTVPAFRLRRREIKTLLETSRATFPGFSMQLFTSGDQLVPVERYRMIASAETAWRVILAPGRIWSEASDAGWSRAALPFTLARSGGGGALNGVATFLFNETEISSFRVQIAQEHMFGTITDAWGTTKVEYQPQSLPDVAAQRQAFQQAEATRLDIRPWEDLQRQFWRSLDQFDGEDGRDRITVSGLMVDDTVFVRACRTRAGPYPFCSRLRSAVFSVSKSMGAAAALFRLAEKYGPEVMDEKILDHVSIPASHDGWADVRFRHALDMTTGVGTLLPRKVDTYVEVDFTALAARVWRARLAEEKLEAMGRFANYPWPPGEVFRYRTSDTDLLAIAMDRFLKSKEGPDARLWDMVTREIYRPLGIEFVPVHETAEADARLNVPMLGGGMLATFEDVLKVARLFQNHGEHKGRQILHRELTRQSVNTDKDRGIPTGWTYADGSKSTYGQSFWLMPFVGRGGCEMRVPAMAGFGGNYVILMPNRVIGFRFADGDDNAPGTWVSKHIREVADQVKGVCG